MNSGIVFECFLELQFLHTSATFLLVSVPLRQIGIIWSTVSCFTKPQYAHDPTGLTIFKLKFLYLLLLSGFFFIHSICLLTQESLFFLAHAFIAILYFFLFFLYRALFLLKITFLFLKKYCNDSDDKHFLQRLFLPNAPFGCFPKFSSDCVFKQVVHVFVMAQHNLVTSRSQ